MKRRLEKYAMAFFKKYGYLRYALACLAILGLSRLSISYSSYLDKNFASKEEFFRPVIQKLLKKGMDSAFAYSLIENEKTKFDDRFIRINVIGYLKKPDYSGFYNAAAIRENREFISEHNDILSAAEAKYGVSKDVIASILWIETRHGKVLGKNHIVSVFFSAAMADQPQFIQLNKQKLRENQDLDTTQLPALDKKIEERAAKKSAWAIDQLIAFAKFYGRSPKAPLEIYGSWAGAFGMSQFLPSSYISWAVDGDKDGKIDLFNLSDAVFSVANYLKSNGWGAEDSLQRKAVFHYNNSSDYVNAVLTLASKSSYQKIDKPLSKQIESLDYHGE
jgi:membrane-bound lytic murein transglycosylase B